MGGSKFIPLVVAGLVGLLIGWLLSPDIDDTETAIAARIDEVQAPIAELQTSVQAIDERTAALAEQAQAAGPSAETTAQIEQLSAAVTSQSEAVAGQIQAITTEIQAANSKLDALQQSLAAVQEEVASAAAAPAAADTGASDAAALASRIGSTGAILLPGQAAVFGQTRVILSSLQPDGSGATLLPQGGEPSDVASGASIDLGNGCSLTLAGVAANAAYLMAEGCAAPAAAGQPAQAAPAAPAEGGQQAAATPAEPAVAAETPAAAPAVPAGQQAAAGTPSGGTGFATGQTAAFGDKSVFVSAIGSDGNSATLFVPGQGRQIVQTGSSIDLGDGCSVTLAGIEGRQANLTAQGCAAAPAAAPTAPPANPQGQAAPAEQATDAAQAPMPAPAAAPTAPPADPQGQAAPLQQATAAAQAGAPAAGAAAAPSDGTGLVTGQTAIFGDKRVFVSAIRPDENSATLYAAGSGRQIVQTGSSMDLGDGCSVTVAAIEGETVDLTAQGCAAAGGQQGTAAPAAAPAAPTSQQGAAAPAPTAPPANPQGQAAPAEQATDAAQAPMPDPAAAPAAPPANPQGAAAPLQQATDAAQQAAPVGLVTGQTLTLGERRIFVTALTPDAATLTIVGGGRQMVQAGQPLDLGDGCSVTLQRIEDRTAYLTSTGC